MNRTRLRFDCHIAPNAADVEIHITLPRRADLAETLYTLARSIEMQGILAQTDRDDFREDDLSCVRAAQLRVIAWAYVSPYTPEGIHRTAASLLGQAPIHRRQPDDLDWTDRPDKPGKYWCADAHGNLWLADVRADADAAGPKLKAAFYTRRDRDWPVGARWFGPIPAPPTPEKTR